MGDRDKIFAVLQETKGILEDLIANIDQAKAKRSEIDAKILGIAEQLLDIGKAAKAKIGVDKKTTK